MYYLNDTRTDPLEGIRLPPIVTEDEHIAQSIEMDRIDAHGGCMHCGKKIIATRCACPEFQERRSHDREVN